jgi:predicted alpha-1,6-mannanase (GH76 family)
MPASLAAAIGALQNWYNSDLGLYNWDDPNLPWWITVADAAKAVAGLLSINMDDFRARYPVAERWWNSANAIAALIDYMSTTGDKTYLSVVDNTFSKAQGTYTVIIDSQINLPSPPFGPGGSIPTSAHKEQYTNFLNRHYDDEGWWALTWIKAYDLTLDPKYLDMAVIIGTDMAAGWDSTFNGGIYWEEDHKGPSGESPYKNAIANELFMAVAARLYLRTKDATWKTWALKEYEWFINSGLIWGTGSSWGTFPKIQTFDSEAKYLINDSLNTGRDNAALSGINDGTQWLWTYNHGVILRALCDLSIILGDPAPRSLAENIANAAIIIFSSTGTPAGNLIEPHFDPTSVDTCQFKGVFIRNLAALYANDHNSAYNTFIANNAASVLANGYPASQFGAIWSSPPDAVDFVRQTAAIDALNAANRVLIADKPISLKSTLALVGQKPSAGVRAAIGGLTSSVRDWVLAVTT